MKEGDEPTEFVVAVDPKKIPAPSAVSKTVPGDYPLEAMFLDAVAGEAAAKDGKPQFKAEGMDRVYLLEKGEAPAGSGPHPYDELVAALKEGAAKGAIGGKLTEESKDGATTFKLAVSSFKKAEAKK